MHTTTNFMIVNMALGDFIATVGTSTGCLKVIQSGYEWKENKWFGQYIFCRIGCSTFMICMLCSIYSLVAITIDRFLAVTRPFKYQNRSSWNKYIIPGIWVASVAIPARYVIEKIEFCSENAKFYCIAQPSKDDAILILVLGFVIPQVVIVTLYMLIAYTLCKRKVPGEIAQRTSGTTSAQKVARKVTRMIVCIFIAFEISWYPAFLGYILPFWYRGDGFADEQQYISYKMLVVCNGITNAIIYAVFNETFKVAFQETLRWHYVKSAFRKMKFGHPKKRIFAGTTALNVKSASSTTKSVVATSTVKDPIPSMTSTGTN